MGKTLDECYEVLGLDFNATEAEIKSAYRQKALQCHPDKNPDDPSSTQKFQELGHAYRRLMGEEDSDEEDDYNEDDDMDLWRDFFFFLFREEIMAKVRCRCKKCGNGGDEDYDFLASLAKEQEEKYQFTEEEMAQFTSFASLKEQREANKQKFCNKNISSHKPEQKSDKGNKPKLKSNKQLKREQWKKEKEISEIAAQINQNPKRQEKKAFKKKDLYLNKSSDQPVTLETDTTKEQTDHASYNKRNTRKKRNRKKSRKQENQEKDSSQERSNSFRTAFQQKVASSSVTQNGIKKVPLKPETTKRQDDVTLPLHTNYAQQKMIPSCSQRNLPEMGNNSPVCPKWPVRGSFQSPRLVTTGSRAPCASNIWEKRQEKQQLLAELQPANQTDEELQLQIALELSKKQAEIDAQQREISILEKQVEETIQIGKSAQLEAVGNSGSSAPGSYPPAGDSLGSEQECDVVDALEIEENCDAEEEWVVASASEEEWGDTDKEDNEAGEFVPMTDEDEWDYSNCGRGEAEGAKGHQNSYNDPDEKHRNKLPASSCDFRGRDDVMLHNSVMQLSGYSADDGPHACPFGKNCCLGKRCKYSHPVSVDKRKREKSFIDGFVTQDEHDSTRRVKKDNDNNDMHKFEEKHDISLGVSCKGLPVPTFSDGRSLSMAKSDPDDSTPNDAVKVIEPEVSAMQLLGSAKQPLPVNSKLENISPSLMNNLPGLKTYEDGPLPTQEKPKMSSAINSDGYGRVERVKNAASVQEKEAAVSSADVGNSPPPATFPSTGAVRQSAATMPQVGNLSLDAKVQNSAYRTNQPINYVKPLPSSLPVGFSAPFSQSTGQTELLSGNTREPPNLGTGHQASSVPLTQQPMAMNNYPAMSGFPLFPFGNLPFLNTANVALFNQSLLAMASLGRMPLPIIPGPSSGVLNSPQGRGDAMYPGITSSHSMKTVDGSGVSTQVGSLPTSSLTGSSGAPAVDNASGTGPHPLQSSQAGLATSGGSQAMPQLDGLSGLPLAAAMQASGYPLQPSQSSPPNSSQSTVQAMPQVGASAGMPLEIPMSGAAVQRSQCVTNASSLSSTGSMLPLQVNAFTEMPNVFGAGLSQAGLTGIPQSSALDMSQALGLPLPLLNSQALFNMNAQMATLGVPLSNSLNDSQTTLKLRSGLVASQIQPNGDAHKVNTVKHPGSEAQKPAEPTIEEGRECSGIRPKVPSLRRPSTVPKVIQHQTLK